MEKKILHIGRAPDNDIIIEEDSISKKHIQLSFENGSCYVRDVGSSNGTSVNDVRIPLYELMPLQAGDTLKLAHVAFPWQTYFEAYSQAQNTSAYEKEPINSAEPPTPVVSPEVQRSSVPKKSLKESIIKHKKKVNRVQDFAFYALLGLTLIALMVWYFTSVTKP